MESNIVTADVLFTEQKGKEGHLGIITLNRPAVLNSLNHSMVVAIHAQLKQWVETNEIKAVVVRAGEGRAFCAGGDLRSMYEHHHINDKKSMQFFYDEYQLNRYIFHFKKPYIALLDGITMGGGVGISIHGSHRVVSENLLFAMPETGIGFFPDVGGTYFLPRLSDYWGYYLGLTGKRLQYNDCIALKIATQHVKQDVFPALIRALADAPFQHDAKQTVTKIITEFCRPTKPSFLLEAAEEISSCFAKNSMEEIVESLKRSRSEAAQEAYQALLKKSPTSLKVTLRALQKGAALSFDACMQQEFRLVSHFLQKHDFLEGIRALIIDKDQSPLWQPLTLNEITTQDVEEYFYPVKHELAINQ